MVVAAVTSLNKRNAGLSNGSCARVSPLSRDFTRQLLTDLPLMIKTLLNLVTNYGVRLWTAATQACECWEQHGGIVHALLSDRLAVAHAVEDQAGDSGNVSLDVAFDGEVHGEQQQRA